MKLRLKNLFRKIIDPKDNPSAIYPNLNEHLKNIGYGTRAIKNAIRNFDSFYNENNAINIAAISLKKRVEIVENYLKEKFNPNYDRSQLDLF